MSSSKSSGSERAGSEAEAIAAVLSGAANAVRAWSDEDINAFLAGRKDLIIRAAGRPGRRAKPAREMVQQQASEVRAALSAMATREEGVAYLEELGLDREGLRALVAGLDLPSSKSDNMQRLRDRIIEALIGYRLRSQAIRGGGHDVNSAGRTAADSKSRGAAGATTDRAPVDGADDRSGSP